MALIDQQIVNNIPTVLLDQIVFCDKLWNRRKRYLLFLARDLKFYNFCDKELINCIDLSKTCFQKLANNVSEYKGLKIKRFKSANNRSGECMGTVSEHGGIMETTGLQSSVREDGEANTDENISFGKYVYRNFDIHKVYILIHCWDKLVVVAFPEYTFVSEYESVKSYRIVHGKVKFIAMLELLFKNGKTEYMDFQENENTINYQVVQSNTEKGADNFKQLLERVRSSKAELQLHKSATQRDFDNFRSTETYGCNYIRSDLLEEKPMIARCGDIWSRFVTNNTIVFGVPLVNNCSSNSLTIIKNVKPILKMNDSFGENIFYKYRLYQLKVKYEDMDTVETFFQAEDEELRSNEKIWVDCEVKHLLPASFAVLLLAVNTCHLLLQQECPLFLYYEIEKEQPQPLDQPVKTRIYEQHLFLKKIYVPDLFMNREKCKLSFGPATLHKDFLAAAMINNETTLYIEFQSDHDSIVFEKLISKKFNFDTFERNLIKNEFELIHGTGVTLDKDKSNITPEYITSGICFNNDPTSLWFGSMFVKTAPFAKNTIQVWKLHFHSKERAFICIKTLLNELTLLNCNIEHMKHFIKENDESSIFNLKNELNRELKHLSDLNKSIDMAEKKTILMNLMKIQLHSDLLTISVQFT